MHRISLNKVASSKGQTMPYILVMMIVLIISWAMMVNIAKLVQERMMMQNAADNAALSIAAYKAQLLNKLGQLNYLIGCALYGTESGLTNYYLCGTVPGSCEFCPQVGPGVVMALWDNQKKVGCLGDVPASHWCPAVDQGLHESHKIVNSIRALVTGLVTRQKALIAEYYLRGPMELVQTLGKRQQLDAGGQATGADITFIANPQSVLLRELCRNENGIEYYGTRNLCASVYPFNIHGHIFWTYFYKSGKESWLYADDRTFHKNQKIVVTAIKRGDSESNKGYPLFGRWVGIQWPTITTTAAAALYNRGGPMFPLEEKGHPSDDISPVIKAYKAAEKHGWDVHLVPAGRPLLH